MVTYDPNSIWKNRLTALRNSTIFALQFYGGLRRSEVLALEWEDIKPGRGASYPPQICLIDRRNDPEYPRKYKPAVKPVMEYSQSQTIYSAPIDETWREAWDEINDLAEEIGVEENMDHTFVS